MKTINLADILDRIKESPWRGMITEVGFGISLSSYILSSSGASKTILYTDSPYSKLLQPNIPRSVSKEGASAFLDRLEAKIPNEERQNPIFLLAITGSYKPVESDSDSHGWMGLRTIIPRENGPETTTTLLHFRVAKRVAGRSIDKFTAGNCIANTALWLMKAILLGDYTSWADALLHQPISDVVKINIIDDPRISLEEHLQLSEYSNPLVYHNGTFQRVIEYIRQYDRYMSGSFNPPHKSHVEMGENALFLINFENTRKETITESDMAHRIRMLDSLGIPVMIMRERPFVSLQAHLLQSLGRKQLTLITGTDTFNTICDTNFIPAEEELFAPLTDEQKIEAREKILDDFLIPLYKDNEVTFEVFQRSGHELVDNKWSRKMKVTIKENSNPNISSTKIRNGDFSQIPEQVIDYIKQHNLYS